MASQWHTLVTQKLFLARQLADTATSMETAPGREAAIQGATELALRARRLLLVMIARLYQQKQSEPANLDELASLIGSHASELAELDALSRQAGSWWNHLDQLEMHQSRPPAQKKTVSSEKIIAVTADNGPDRSVEALASTLKAARHYADNLEDRHSEW